MLSNREKEIIRNVYMDILKQTYSSSGPSYLSSEDHKEISSFLRELQKDDDYERMKKFTIDDMIKDCTTCEHGKYNDRYKTYFCYNNKKDCKEWNLWEIKRTCRNCKHRIYNLFDGDTYCPKQKTCIRHSEWEERK